MATAYEDIADKARIIVGSVESQAAVTIPQAASNYNAEFRVEVGDYAYQMQLTPVEDKKTTDSNKNFPRLEVSMVFHAGVNSIATEEFFQTVVLYYVQVFFFDNFVWQAGGQLDVDRDIEPIMEVSGIEGRVMTAATRQVILHLMPGA